MEPDAAAEDDDEEEGNVESEGGAIEEVCEAAPGDGGTDKTMSEEDEVMGFTESTFVTALEFARFGVYCWAGKGEEEAPERSSDLR